MINVSPKFAQAPSGRSENDYIGQYTIFVAISHGQWQCVYIHILMCIHELKWFSKTTHAYHVKLHALANATKSPNLWKGLGNSLIHFNTPTHVWWEKRKSTRGHIQEKRKLTRGHKREKRKSTRGYKGGQQQFYNKLQKPGLELKILGSDTMLSFMH
jgi:hypothetical protein